MVIESRNQLIAARNQLINQLILQRGESKANGTHNPQTG